MNERIDNIYRTLAAHISESDPLLVFESCYQLLISVIMSAQTTDAQVNEVTPALFAEYPEPDDLSGAPQEDVERLIHSTGFYRVKARNIRGAARMLCERFDGIVPESMEKLLELPGVGRKSANVILGHCFDQPAIIVDTHFSRVTLRIGLTEETDPKRLEFAVRQMVPSDIQYRFSMLINRHGRKTCSARSPKCVDCPIKAYCDHGRNIRRP